ncbi:zinc-binding dehydrogenase [Cryptosporangium japonicum]|uniref:Alcohol dehydrogenase n=1 Tax=Cryptosporangium japonicum TaxID=80872 RepID=A0ABN0U7Y8_9ACTN
MRAWKLNSTDDELRLLDVPEPSLRAGGVLVDVLAVHVPAYSSVLTGGTRGSIPTPLVLGAGGLARVVAVADDVTGFAPGDVVVNAGLLREAGAEFIVGWTGIGGRGERTPVVARLQERWRDGTFAERAVLPASVLVPVPGAGDDPRLAFLPWLSIAAEALTGQQPGERVAVLGATGQLGGAAVLVALARGASGVVAVGRNPDALARLAALDRRVVTVRLTGDRPADAAAIRAAGEPDVTVDALGAVPDPGPTLAGYDALRPGGTLVLIGGVRQNLTLAYGDLMRRRMTVRGSWMARPETVAAVWRLVGGGVLDLSALEPRVVGLDDPAAALDLADSTSGLAFVVLVPRAA